MDTQKMDFMLKTLTYGSLWRLGTVFLNLTLHFKLAHKNSTNLKLIFCSFFQSCKCPKADEPAMHLPPPFPPPELQSE